MHKLQCLYCAMVPGCRHISYTQFDGWAVTSFLCIVPTKAENSMQVHSTATNPVTHVVVQHCCATTSQMHVGTIVGGVIAQRHNIPPNTHMCFPFCVVSTTNHQWWKHQNLLVGSWREIICLGICLQLVYWLEFWLGSHCLHLHSWATN